MNSTMHKTRANGHDIDSKLTMRSATKSPMKPNTAPDAPTNSVQTGSKVALMKLAPTPAAVHTEYCHYYLYEHEHFTRGWYGLS